MKFYKYNQYLLGALVDIVGMDALRSFAAVGPSSTTFSSIETTHFIRTQS